MLNTTIKGEENLADVSGLDIKVDYIPEDEVEAGGTGKSYGPPPDGKYFGQAPIITDESFGVTAAGYLSATLDPITIIAQGGQPGDGYQVRFTRLSSKQYSNKKTSQVIEFLRACGVSATPKTADEAKLMLKACSGKTFQFALQWEAYDKDAQKSVKGMDNFPIGEDGKPQPWVAAEYDATQRVWANGKVRFYISAVK